MAMLAVLALASACSYQHRQFRAGDRASGVDPEMHYVEADDYGWFWEPRQALDALDAVRSSGNTDTLVMLFVAGWHHSARCCDDNVEGFKDVLRKLQVELGKGMYREARRIIHPHDAGPVRVIGIYIGWRGQSLPGWLDCATFWGRKAAATRVGETDLREFLIELRNTYEQHTAALRTSSDRRLLGLITIGHSFGGQVVLRATSSFIEEELMQLNPPPAYLRLPVMTGTGPTLNAPVKGFGDLVVLINPALEAAAYQKLHALGMGFQYDPAQTPLMLTISADNDKPRKTFFPLGRVTGEIFTGRPHIADTRERGMERAALGFYPEQVTHRLHPAGCSPGAPCDKQLQKEDKTVPPDPKCSGQDHYTYTWYSWRGASMSGRADSLSAEECTPEVLRSIYAHDFSSTTVFGDVVLEPSQGALPHQALIVASATSNVIDGHNGMFSAPLIDFLTRYIGFVEARRFLPLVQPEDCGGRPAS